MSHISPALLDQLIEELAGDPHPLLSLLGSFIKGLQTDIEIQKKVSQDLGELLQALPITARLEVAAYQLKWKDEGLIDIRLERCRQAEGPDRWAIRKGEHRVLSRETGKWEFEPSPSNRDDGFYARCRFDSEGEALAFWNQNPLSPAGSAFACWPFRPSLRAK